MRHTSTLLVSILSTILLAGASQQALAQCQDNDGDGYCSVPSGGNDCGDLISAYKETTTGVCKETLQPVFIPAPLLYPGDPRKFHDHSWFRDTTDTYHLFAHNTDVNVTGAIRHFTSADLKTIQNAANLTAITSTTGKFDHHALWAPHVVEQGAAYFMYFTGANFGPSNVMGGVDDVYKIGFAASQDLSTWFKVPDPVFDCETAGPDGTVAEWVEKDSPGYSDRCRDPFVMYDDAQGRWLLFATALLKTGVTPGPASEGIIVAQSANVFGPWNHLGYIKATKTLYATDGGTGGQLPADGTAVAENPFVTYFNGRYYLFFKDWKDPESNEPGNIKSMIQYATSETLAFDSHGSANWTYRGYIPDPGMSAAEIIVHEEDTWIMSAYVSNCFADPAGCPNGVLLHENELRLKRIVWDGTGGFTTRNLTNLSCRVASESIHPFANDPCNDGVDQDCNPCTNSCGGGGHGDPTQE